MRIGRIGMAMVALAVIGIAISVAFKASDSIAVIALIYASTGGFLVGVTCLLLAIAGWSRQRP